MSGLFGSASRIVGGVPVDSPIPFQVLYKYGYDSSWGVFTKFCGGVILNEFTVVTAAQCITSATDRGSIVAGILHLVHHGSDMQVIPVALKYAHPEFDLESFQNDIAILCLSSPLQFGQTVSSATFNANTSVPEEQAKVLACGWGSTSEDSNSLSEELRQVDLAVHSDGYCQQVYDDQTETDLPTFFRELMLCAGDPGGGDKDTCHGDAGTDKDTCDGDADTDKDTCDGDADTDKDTCDGDADTDKDTCDGDAGGPLYLQFSENQKPLIVGITSFGHGCGRRWFPGIYTRISSYLQWIQETSQLCHSTSTASLGTPDAKRMLLVGLIAMIHEF
ncbi:unnamed protein product [Cyprideis torosa]|uniref:Uncharacterized protein n=1 Tax=Cyprideis torosa TaxID=163714 RepID=A0A7R8W635_9CRUS|nr:unnamed protein product [Cyprideis torosa]CAG0880597.1 unnamed protein product [Cyprideis torosa]